MLLDILCAVLLAAVVIWQQVKHERITRALSRTVLAHQEVIDKLPVVVLRHEYDIGTLYEEYGGYLMVALHLHGVRGEKLRQSRDKAIDGLRKNGASNEAMDRFSKGAGRGIRKAEGRSS